MKIFAPMFARLVLLRFHPFVVVVVVVVMQERPLGRFDSCVCLRNRRRLA
jgi:hypothetical protein